MIQLAAYEEYKKEIFTDSVTDLRSEIYNRNVIYHIETYKKLWVLPEYKLYRLKLFLWVAKYSCMVR
jgi:hypothetical protein